MKDKIKNITGLILCVIGIVVLIYLFPMFKLLILIPIFLFVISVYVKRFLVNICVKERIKNKKIIKIGHP